MKVSVVIPCRNEVHFIHECIEAVFNNSLDKSVELAVFVVDGMSNDGTRESVIQLQITYQNLYLVDNLKQLTPFSFNLGIQAQSFDFVQIVGARQILSIDYLSKALDVFSNDDSVWCVGGNVENVYINETGKTISKAMSTAFGMGLGNFRTLTESCFTDTVGTPIYPAWVFERIGFFDEELIRNQDDDFNYRVTKAGGKIWFESEISLKYYVRSNFKGLYRQFYQYGYWKVFVNQKHKVITTIRQLAPPAFVFFLFVSPILILLGSFFLYSTIAVYGIYLLLGIYFSFKPSKGIREFFKILKTFPILHFSYGIGYLSGIINFLILRQKPSDKQKRLSR